MKDYSSEKDLYTFAKNLAYRFTLDKYKTFLIQNELIKKDTLEEPFGRFSGIIVKEEYIRETLMFLWSSEKFDRLIEILYGEEITQEPIVDVSVNKKENPVTNIPDSRNKSIPTIGRKLRVFLCHTSQDKPIVRELYQRLLAEGWIEPWLDEEKLLPGQDWDIEIEKSVEMADVVVVCLSTNSVTKEGYIQKELRFVLDVSDEKPEGTIFVTPVRLDDCLIPRRLRKWQYVDFFPKDRKDWAYKKLLMSLDLRFQRQENVAEKLAPKPAEQILPILNKDEYSHIDEIIENPVVFSMSKDNKNPDNLLVPLTIAIVLWVMICIGIIIAIANY